jgi:hypothetical protein
VRRRFVEIVLGTLLIAVHVALLVQAAWQDSDTIDEPGHLVAALSYWRHGSFRLYCVNPPLARLVQGLPLLPLDLRTSMIVEPDSPQSRRELGIGDVFAEANADRYRSVVFLARLGTVAFSLLGGVFVWTWANLAFGQPCGIVALAVWCFEPSILAHGHLATPDLPAAVLALAAAFALRGYLLRPSWLRAAVAGGLLGMAELSKFTLLILCPLWVLIALLTTWTASNTSSRPRLRHGLLLTLVCLLTLNAGYLFQGTGRRLETYHFASSKFGEFTGETLDTLHGPTNALAGTWLGAIPMPVPAPYVEGIDLQARDFDRYTQNRTQFFLAGRWGSGRYYYYLYGLLSGLPIESLHCASQPEVLG